MKIEKKYHFYAAHRNHAIKGKCANIHGHTYYVTVVIDARDPDDATGVTVLFDDIDKVVEPIIKRLDHKMLLSKDDPIYEKLIALREHIQFVEMRGATSVENVCIKLFDEIYHAGINITEIRIQETTTSTVTYNGQYNRDSRCGGTLNRNLVYPTPSE